MIDSVIRAGAQFDFIGSACRLIHREIFRAAGYNVPEDCGLSLYAIQDLLKGYGIKTHWPAIIGDVGSGTMTFNVSRNDAWMAQGIMQQAGIPYTGGRAFDKPFRAGALQQARAPIHGGRRSGSRLGRAWATIRDEVFS